jgi:predicted GNAT family acetyltransferase
MLPVSSTPGTSSLLRAEALSDSDHHEVLDFLALRPIHTVCMASYIRDHGVLSPRNRGAFYGCRNEAGELEGVALIGHATLLESQNDEALKAFALLQHQHSGSHLVRGEHEMIRRFWDYFAALGHTPRLLCRELLFELRVAPEAGGTPPPLRNATVADLDQVMQVNAHMILAECGINPLIKDPAGFRERLARRIRQGRIWVWTEQESLIFKADIFAETPEMIYLEGVNVHGPERGRGYGRRCMSELGRLLLQRSRAICLLVNEQKEELSDFYRKAGYKVRGTYDTIYLDEPAH